jgi:nucleoside-diphosphate-sugar epimerase
LREINASELQAKYDPPRDGDIRDSQADITLAREALKYHPTVDFPEGLRRTFAWYQESEAKAAKQKEVSSE